MEALKELFADTRLKPGVALYNFALVATGARPASLFTLPAELPDGPDLGRRIDESVMARVGGEPVPGKGALARFLDRAKDQYRRSQMPDGFARIAIIREEYDRIVSQSESYRACLEWTKRLGLEGREVEVRPTIREMYLYRDKDYFTVVEDLMDLRRTLRQEASRSLPANAPMIRRIYPEEWNAEYLRRVGQLLGFPACCQEAYIRDRLEDRISPEERAARQLEEYILEGRKPDARAYFTKDFFPCRPDCHAAIEIADRGLAALNKVSEWAYTRYYQALRENLEWVEQLPGLLKSRASQINQT